MFFLIAYLKNIGKMYNKDKKDCVLFFKRCKTAWKHLLTFRGRLFLFLGIFVFPYYPLWWLFFILSCFFSVFFRYFSTFFDLLFLHLLFKFPFNFVDAFFLLYIKLRGFFFFLSKLFCGIFDAFESFTSFLSTYYQRKLDFIASLNFAYFKSIGILDIFWFVYGTVRYRCFIIMTYYLSWKRYLTKKTRVGFFLYTRFHQKIRPLKRFLSFLRRPTRFWRRLRIRISLYPRGRVIYLYVFLIFIRFVKRFIPFLRRLEFRLYNITMSFYCKVFELRRRLLITLFLKNPYYIFLKFVTFFLFFLLHFLFFLLLLILFFKFIVVVSYLLFLGLRFIYLVTYSTIVALFMFIYKCLSVCVSYLIGAPYHFIRIMIKHHTYPLRRFVRTHLERLGIIKKKVPSKKKRRFS